MTTINNNTNILITQDVNNKIYFSNNAGLLYEEIKLWPVTIVNTNPIASNIITVFFNSPNILLNNSINQYFIVGSQYITFDGNNNTITVGVDGWLGLLKNGTGINAFANITIKNIGVKTTNNSTINLANNSGWLCQSSFGNYGKNGSNNQIINCYSTGNIGINSKISGCGGLVGFNPCVQVSNCYSTGNISNRSYGIIGQNGISCSASNCYSTGNIDNYSAGIMDGGNGFDSASNCFSTGNISNNSVGIAGVNYGTFTFINNCYSSGNITNNSAGISNGSHNVVYNSYSTGIIDGTSGGIYKPGSNRQIINCYWNGLDNLSGSGTSNMINCYGFAGSWNDTIANSKLVKGTTWVNINLGLTTIPWLLKSFNKPNYNPTSQTINIGTSYSTNNILPGSQTNIISINGLQSNPNITINNGQLSFTSLLNVGVYDVLLINYDLTLLNIPIKYNISTFTLTVTKITPTQSNFILPNKILGDSPFVITPPTSNSDGKFNYSSLNTSVVTILDNIITVKAVGTAEIVATQLETTNYISKSISTIISVGDLSNFTIRLIKRNSSAYIDVPSSYLKINKNRNNSIGFDLCYLTVNVPSLTKFSDGTNIRTPLSQVGKIKLLNIDYNVNANIGSECILTYYYRNYNIQSINLVPNIEYNVPYTDTNYFEFNGLKDLKPFLRNFIIPVKTYGNSSFIITPPITNSNGTFSYTSSNTSVATISDNIINIVGSGTSKITATQSATTNFASDIITANLQVNRGTPNLTNFTIPEKAYGDQAFTITPPVTNSDGKFKYISSNNLVATVTNNIITIIGVGTSIITAIQEETTNYLSESIITQLTVKKGDTIITFDDIIKTFGDVDFTPNVKSNRDGNLILISSNLNVATITNSNQIKIIGAGTSYITASQLATDNYNFGLKISIIKVNKASTKINLNNITKTFGDDPFIPKPTTNSDGLISYLITDPNVAIYQLNQIYIKGVGRTLVIVKQDSSNNYLESQTTFDLIIKENNLENSIISGKIESNQIVSTITSFVNNTKELSSLIDQKEVPSVIRLNTDALSTSLTLKEKNA